MIRLSLTARLSLMFMLAVTGVLAAAMPARRAARYDPAVAIRYV